MSEETKMENLSKMSSQRTESTRTFLRDIEMSNSSTDTLNFLHLRNLKKERSNSIIKIKNGQDWKMYAIRRKSRFGSDLRDGMLFDAIGIHFNLSIFFYQLFLHLVFPSILFVKNRRAQGVRFKWPYIYWNIISPIIVYVMIGTYLGSTYSDQDILGQSIFIPLLFFVVHRAIIALKYASLSNTEYDRFINCRDKKKLDGYNSQIHLSSGWNNLDPSVLYFELGAASARIGIKINEIFLYICDGKENSVSEESHFRFWNAFMRGHDTLDWDSKPAPEIQTLPSGRIGISVYNIVMALVLRAVSKDSHPFYINFLLLAIVILIIAISYVPVCAEWNSIDSEAMVTIFQMCSTIINFQFGYVFFSLLYMAIIDIKRQKRMVEMLHCMIRSTDLMMQNNLSLLPPGEIMSDRCREVAEARINAILSITDVHEWQPIGNTPSGIKLQQIPEQDEEDEDDDDIGPIELSNPHHDEETKEYHHIPPELESLNEGDEVRHDRASEVLGENIAKDSSYAVTPRITFRYPQNVTAWLYARLAVQHFGDRFRARIDTYVGVSLLLTVFLMLVALIIVFSSSDRRRAFQSVFFVQAFLAVTLLLVYLLLIFYLGSLVNDELGLHKKTLMVRAIKIRSKLQCLSSYSPTSPEIGRLGETLENIEMAQNVIEINNELKPIQILGFNAQIALTMSILTAAISFYSTLFTLYLRGGSLDSTASQI